MRMPWTVSTDPRFPVIETIYSGQLSRQELAEAFEETKNLVIESGRRLLIAEFPVKEAVILSEALSSAEMARFWETTCYNRGINVQVFTGRNDALAWLVDGDGR